MESAGVEAGAKMFVGLIKTMLAFLASLSRKRLGHPVLLDIKKQPQAIRSETQDSFASRRVISLPSGRSCRLRLSKSLRQHPSRAKQARLDRLRTGIQRCGRFLDRQLTEFAQDHDLAEFCGEVVNRSADRVDRLLPGISLERRFGRGGQFV